VPRTVWAHGWLMVGGKKMSKTAITGIHPRELVATFGSDALRYYVLRDISFGQDGNFSWEALHERYTTDLGNDLGNLVNRVLNMAVSYLDGAVPEPVEDRTEAGRVLAEEREGALTAVTEGMERLDFRAALEGLWRSVRAANRYVDATTPWALNKQGRTEELARVMYTLLDTLRGIAVLASFVLPVTAERIWERLSLDGQPADQHLPEGLAPGRMPAGTTVTKGTVLFPRVDPDEA
jgi:methionyl-tRNA synthetase